MSKPHLTQKSFELLEELKVNNNREWYTEHKEAYAESVQTPFTEILEEASVKMAKTKYPMLGGKETVFRIYRDVRFSKDKRPYKDKISGLLTPSGTKAEDEGLIYVHLNTDGGFLASGFHQLDNNRLTQVRQHIIDETKTFTSIVKNLNKAGYEFSDMEKLKRMPRGFEDYESHEHADLLKMKSLVVQATQTKKAWLDGTIVDEIVKINKAATDLTLFGLAALAKK